MRVLKPPFVGVVIRARHCNRGCGSTARHGAHLKSTAHAFDTFPGIEQAESLPRVLLAGDSRSWIESRAVVLDADADLALFLLDRAMDAAWPGMFHGVDDQLARRVE